MIELRILQDKLLELELCITIIIRNNANKHAEKLIQQLDERV